MSERTHLNNGRFLHDLNGWTASGASYSAGDGDGHYGVAVLSTGGDYIEQDFAVPDVKSYTLHTAIKPIGAAATSGQVTARIMDGDGNTVVTLNLTGAQDVWSEAENIAGLAPGTTYTLRITNVSATGDVRVDDVWLWFVPVTRAQLAQRVHNKLGRLASERQYYPTPTGILTEGSYTYAVDAALLSFGALNPETGNPDIRYLDANQVQTVLNMVRSEMLETLQADYAVEVDNSVGPYRQSLSQKSKNIGDMLGGGGSSGGSGGSGGAIIQRNLDHDNGWS